MVGEPCGENSECCSYACRDDGAGLDTCQYLGGCRPYGELCRKDSDCCNDAVNGGPGVCEISNTETGVGRCGNPGGCAPAGEVCVGGSNECCPGNPDGQEFCLPTAIGVDRCLVSGQCKLEGVGCATPDECCSGICEGGTCGALACFADGESCAFSDQCCSGYCLPDAAGNLVCGAACVADGGDCTASTDCCNGYCDSQSLACGVIIQ